MHLNYRGHAYQSFSPVERPTVAIQIRYRGQSYSLRSVIESSEQPVTQRLRYRGVSYEC